MPQPPTTQQKQQGRRRRPQSRYGVGLQEKQGLKKMFGLREEQLKRYYKQALKVKGETGPTLVTLLERRLDNAVYRAGFAQTRAQARQMTTHRLFTVNGKAVDVPSYSLKSGDKVAVRESKKGKSFFTSFDKRMQNYQGPSWIIINPAEYGFTVASAPSYEEANIGVDMRVVVEFFAR